MKVSVIVPVLNEEQSISQVLRDLPREGVDEVIVVDNGSTDRSREVARSAGARVVEEAQKGYGAACFRGVQAVASPDIVVFLDGDYSDDPRRLPELVRPIIKGEADFVLGSRVKGHCEPGALLWHARLGNRFATWLIKRFFGVKYTDVGPFRAIRYDRLCRLGLQDRGFGWTVEMQIKAAQQRLRIQEVALGYRRRIGTSKISGTFGGSVRAARAIVGTIFRYAWASPRKLN